MNCSRCHASDTKVIESRDVAGGKSIRRRRMCSQCAHRFTTYERIERPQLIVVKNNDVREIFNRDKLLAGLYRACEKTSVTSLQLEQLVSDVETQLYECSDPEVPSSKIGELVMEQLSGLNEVAYVRFASVYRRFKDIASFEKELSDIRKRKDKVR
ncbi:MAG TPA: transcriptional regulator NrdR [Candidatus Saccharimonadales bacterium]|nr:transcriptional regulator NrdR [Candidatus Saccharimonadales bacterium]